MTDPALAISTPHGRQYKHPENGALYPSITNVIDVLAKPWLAGWKAKMVAGHAWDNRRILVDIEDRDAAVDMLKGGPTRARNAAAAVGDLIHSYAEAVAGGAEPPTIPEELEDHVAPFVAFMHDYSPRFLVLEGTVFRGGPDNPDRYAGSFDFLAEVFGFNLLGDYKSGANVYDEVALQLAALRNGHELWDEATGDLLPMPKVDACIAVHLQPNRLGVHLIDANDHAFGAFLGLRRAWPWDKEHHGAVGVRLNPERLARELRRPDTLLAQLEMSVEEASPAAASATESDGVRDQDGGASVAGDNPEGAAVTAARGAAAPAGDTG